MEFDVSNATNTELDNKEKELYYILNATEIIKPNSRKKKDISKEALTQSERVEKIISLLKVKLDNISSNKTYKKLHRKYVDIIEECAWIIINLKYNSNIHKFYIEKIKKNIN